MSTPSEFHDFVPFTARMMAAIRAQESERRDRLFTDPYAAQLAGAEAIAAIQDRLIADDLTYVAVRTRFFDDFIQANVPPLLQVVMLAAGMDTRAYRLDWSEAVAIYELDQPGVLERKASLIKDVRPQCSHHLIGADLTQPWRDRLLGAGFQGEQPSLWLLEGLLMYLTEAEVRQLLETLSGLTAPGSVMGLDLLSPASMNYTSYQGYFKSGFESPEELLAEYGWEAIAHQPGDAAANYGRYNSTLPARSVPNVQRAFLVAATKRSEF